MDYRRFLLPTVLLASLACASNSAQRPASIPKPAINMELAHDVFFGSSSSAGVTIDFNVQNPASEPITVRRIELESPGMVQWGFPRQQRAYKEVVAPGETKRITFFATARTNTSRPSEPLSYRARVEFEAQGERWHEWVNVISTRPPS